jgi:hypothetical protein
MMAGITVVVVVVVIVVVQALVQVSAAPARGAADNDSFAAAHKASD